MKSPDIVICDAVRTPFCHNKALKSYSPAALLETVIRELLKRNSLDPETICGVLAGTVMHDSRYSNIARIASMKAGLPVESRDISLQANCNSGFAALLFAIGEIYTGLGELFITCGVDSMSSYGFRLEDRTQKYGSLFEIEKLLTEDGGQAFLENFEVIHSLSECLTDTESDLSMIEIGEVMANYFGINRLEQEEYTRSRLELAVRAVEEKMLEGYIIPVGDLATDTYPLNRKKMLRREDSFSRAALIFGEDNPALSPELFYKKHERHLKKMGIDHVEPTLTMFTSSIPGDGAGGCIVTTEDHAQELGLTPKVRLVTWESSGVEPVIMGIAPLESTRRLFDRIKKEGELSLEFEELDYIEIHEAFASQVLSVFKEGKKRYNMEWDLSRINRYGGSLAYTHPLGATNYRLLANILSYFDHNPDKHYALATGCAGGGYGVSLLFERYGGTRRGS